MTEKYIITVLKKEVVRLNKQLEKLVAILDANPWDELLKLRDEAITRLKASPKKLATKESIDWFAAGVVREKELKKRCDEMIDGTDDKRRERRRELECKISELKGWIIRLSGSFYP